jgi:hypothetical protein
MTCHHDRKPVPGWYARYRCALCGAFGYKQRFIRTDEFGPGIPKSLGTDRITPYLGSHKPGGAPCRNVGVTKEGGRWKCSEHRRARPTDRARAHSKSDATRGLRVPCPSATAPQP